MQVYTNAVSVSTKFPQKPFYIILNTVRGLSLSVLLLFLPHRIPAPKHHLPLVPRVQAVGGTWPGSPNATTVWPQHHIIDYVRYYERP